MPYVKDGGDILDYERLRGDLIDYYGTAMQYFPMAFMEVSEVENASEEKLLDMAEKAGFDINDYIWD